MPQIMQTAHSVFTHKLSEKRAIIGMSPSIFLPEESTDKTQYAHAPIIALTVNETAVFSRLLKLLPVSFIMVEDKNKFIDEYIIGENEILFCGADFPR